MGELVVNTQFANVTMQLYYGRRSANSAALQYFMGEKTLIRSQARGRVFTSRQSHCAAALDPITWVTRIGVNTTAFGLTLCFSAIPLSRFPLEMSRFFCVFRVGKMRSMCSAQRQMEPGGNQLSVLGKDNSLCKMLYFACLLSCDL